MPSCTSLYVIVRPDIVGTATKMSRSEFGVEWSKADTDRDDGVTAQELKRLWLSTVQFRSETKSGWLSSDEPKVDKPGLDASTEEVVAMLDIDKDGKLGLVEWTVQHAVIEAFLNSRRFRL